MFCLKCWFTEHNFLKKKKYYFLFPNAFYFSSDQHHFSLCTPTLSYSCPYLSPTLVWWSLHIFYNLYNEDLINFYFISFQQFNMVLFWSHWSSVSQMSFSSLSDLSCGKELCNLLQKKETHIYCEIILWENIVKNNNWFLWNLNSQKSSNDRWILTHWSSLFHLSI